jgi:hypothetical protein
VPNVHTFLCATCGGWRQVAATAIRREWSDFQGRVPSRRTRPEALDGMKPVY